MLANILLLGINGTAIPGPGTHDQVSVLSRLVRVLKWGFLFDERRSMTSTDGKSLPSIGHLFWLH
jgi:hypothetical protein